MKNIVDATYIPVLRVSRRMPALSGEVVSFLDSLLQRNPARRLGAVMPSTGKVNARDHPWFSTVDWDAALRRELDAGFVPTIASNKDVSNFDDVFTRETAELSGEQAFEGERPNPSGEGFGVGDEGEDSSVSSAEGGGSKSRKNVTWMNLWGLLGGTNNEDDLDLGYGSSPGAVDSLATTQRGDEAASKTGKGVTAAAQGGNRGAQPDGGREQDVFASFDGFSFDAPSLAAMSIAEEGE